MFSCILHANVNETDSFLPRAGFRNLCATVTRVCSTIMILCRDESCSWTFLASTHTSQHTHGLFAKCARISWMVRQNEPRVSLNALPDSDSQDMEHKCKIGLLPREIRCPVSTFQKVPIFPHLLTIEHSLKLSKISIIYHLTIIYILKTYIHTW